MNKEKKLTWYGFDKEQENTYIKMMNELSRIALGGETENLEKFRAIELWFTYLK